MSKIFDEVDKQLSKLQILAPKTEVMTAALMGGIDSDIVDGFTPQILTPAAVREADVIIVADQSHIDFINQNFPQANGKTFLLKALSPNANPDSLNLADPQAGEISEDGAFKEISQLIDNNLMPLLRNSNAVQPQATAVAVNQPAKPSTVSKVSPANSNAGQPVSLEGLSEGRKFEAEMHNDWIAMAKSPIHATSLNTLQKLANGEGVGPVELITALLHFSRLPGGAVTSSNFDKLVESIEILQRRVFNSVLAYDARYSYSDASDLRDLDRHLEVALKILNANRQALINAIRASGGSISLPATRQSSTSAKEMTISWGGGVVSMKARPSTQEPGAIRVHTISVNGRETPFLIDGQLGDSLLIKPGQDLEFGREATSRAYIIRLQGRVFFAGQVTTPSGKMMVFANSKSEDNGNFEFTRKLSNVGNGKLSVQTLSNASNTVVNDGVNAPVTLGENDNRSFDMAMRTDKAALVKSPAVTRGGIDFNAANLNLQIKRDGNGVPLPISQQILENIHIDGLIPVLLGIKPAMATPLLSELQSSQAPQLASVS